MINRSCPRLSYPKVSGRFSWNDPRYNRSPFSEALVGKPCNDDANSDVRGFTAMAPTQTLAPLTLNLTEDQVNALTPDRSQMLRLKPQTWALCNASKPSKGPGTEQPCPTGMVWWDPAGSTSDLCCKLNMSHPGEMVDMHCESTYKYKNHRCVALLPSVDCPIFGPAVASKAAAVDSTKYNRNYTCTYDTSQLAATCAAATGYTNYIREQKGDHFWFDDDLMYSMCSKRADPGSCPDKASGYKDANGIICSNMIACPLCQEWAASNQATATGMKLGDQVMKAWCAEHSTTASPETGDPACQCINRDYMSIVQKMQGAKIADPLCWFTPCVDHQLKRYLVPSDQRAPSCPDSICTQVIDFAGNQGIETEDMQQYMNCGGTSPTPTPSKKSIWDSLSSGQKIGVIAGGSIGALLLLGGVYWALKNDE